MRHFLRRTALLRRRLWRAMRGAFVPDVTQAWENKPSLATGGYPVLSGVLHALPLLSAVGQGAGVSGWHYALYFDRSRAKRWLERHWRAAQDWRDDRRVRRVQQQLQAEEEAEAEAAAAAAAAAAAGTPGKRKGKVAGAAAGGTGAAGAAAGVVTPAGASPGESASPDPLAAEHEREEKLRVRMERARRHSVASEEQAALQQQLRQAAVETPCFYTVCVCYVVVEPQVRAWSRGAIAAS